MKINFSNLTEFQRFYVANVFANTSEEFQKNWHPEEDWINISVFYDNEEVDFFTFVKRLEDSFDDCVKEEAEKQIQAKLNDIFDEIEGYKSIRKKLEDSLCAKLGIKKDDDF